MAHPSSLLDGHHVVVTPEYVEFDFVLAGLYSRFLAWLLDSFVVAMLSLVVITVVNFTLQAFQGFALALGFIIWFLMDWGYAIVLESVWSGQTLGKRVLGIRVVQETGVRVGFYHSALRNLTRPLDRLPLFYLVGGTAAMFSGATQRLGDLLAGTVVIKDRRLKIPAQIVQAAGEPHLLTNPLFLSRVDTLSREEQELVLSAALRREELGMEARLSLFSALSARLQESLRMTKEAHHSDEKWVLLTAAALVKKRERRTVARSTPQR